MVLKIKAIGGYGEFGKNMTYIEVNGKIILLDIGIHLDNYITFMEDHEGLAPTVEELIEVGAVPDVFLFKERFNDVIAIIPSHAHFDHVFAAPYLIKFFPNAKVYASPYTTQFILNMFRQENKEIPTIITQDCNSRFKINKDITIEFIYVTHSIPHTVMICVETKEGRFLYTNDYKFDDAPVIGPKSNIKRLEELSPFKAIIVDSTRAVFPGTTKTEVEVREMLFNEVEKINNDARSIFILTFSSQLQRLKTIKDVAKRVGREAVFLGRSLAKYIYAAHDIKLTKIAPKQNIAQFPNKIRRILKMVSENPKKYIIVTTGHQGEPTANLCKIDDGILDYPLKNDDWIIFSCTVIPNPVSVQNRKILESKLAQKKVNILKDIHASGHASHDEIKKLIEVTKPEFIFPSAADKPFEQEVAKIAKSINYNNSIILEIGKEHIFE